MVAFRKIQLCKGVPKRWVLLCDKIWHAIIDRLGVIMKGFTIYWIVYEEYWTIFIQILAAAWDNHITVRDDVVTFVYQWLPSYVGHSVQIQPEPELQ